MSFETLLFEKKSGYAIISLNRPDKLNALNGQLFADLAKAIALVAENSEIHAVIITGSGAKAFAAGADIAELHNQDESSGAEFSKVGQRVFDAIEHLGKPVVAAVNGFALGGGCELALACHIRFAATNAKFGQPEVNLGILPGYGGTQRLTRIVGVAKSAELILSGNIINADDALRIGLVNSLHEPNILMEFTEKFVQTVVSKAPLAVYAALESIIACTKLSHQQGMNLESQKFGEICGSADFKEGTKAFLEKRPATFTGK
jgi:enoyl-CoA hydratase